MVSSWDTEEVKNVMVYSLDRHIVVVSLKMPFGARDEGVKL